MARISHRYPQELRAARQRLPHSVHRLCRRRTGRSSTPIGDRPAGVSDPWGHGWPEQHLVPYSIRYPWRGKRLNPRDEHARRAWEDELRRGGVYPEFSRPTAADIREPNQIARVSSE
jgi:hypothetical protein